MKTFYIVRHGETAGNAGGVYQDATIPLSDTGREQAKAVAERCAKLPIEAMIVSSMQRTRETALFISERVSAPVEFSDLFIERKIPTGLAGRKKTDTDVMGITKEIHTFDAGKRYADEENFDDLKARAGKALAFLQQRPENSVLVVSHGMFMRTLIARAIFSDAMTPNEFNTFMQATFTINTGITVLTYDEDASEDDPEGPRAKWRLKVFNDHAHLG
jgi:broad specificity phosphatase PhoE